ncbi:LysR family transcriptional regulator [Rhodococcus sp. AD45-ID]|uniref:DNA-binding transcriptional LysR family regulator n=2 Tax=Nocardiaceae TaxID=85025 RepID=A0A652YKS0_NOCGL|nr:HTH-type transcriptional activator CmpR [Rhodococcus sp. AD45]NRI69309.1 LysR family transcriptional regulator [Rhodococcus sp. MS16]PSR42314.1 LysR family transcriptional regulator [Rhodococcus sp. AD45-ID]PVX63562.1 DNA-binding transcriptional LysR family regulator [Rhodococcus globerulus]RZL21180.1 MAG: LysR family transcriptional regulator [Rhodococcus sp. (in: high G+C Gram-positive bacteria)]
MSSESRSRSSSGAPFYLPGHDIPAGRLARMEVQQLRCIVAVADYAHFTRAAQSLHLTQPALSNAIAKLEKELELKIFVRTPRGAEVSVDGARVVDSARRVLHSLGELNSVVDSIKGVTTGALRIATRRTFMRTTTELVRRFHEKYPLVSIDVTDPMTDEEVFDAVDQGKCDVGFCRIGGRLPGLDFQVLYESELVVLSAATADDCPPRVLSWPDVAELELIAPSAGSPVRVGLERIFIEQSLQMKVCIESENFESRVDMARMGLGSTIADRVSVLGLPGFRIDSINPPIPTKIGVINRSHSVPPTVHAFKSLAREYFTDNFPQVAQFELGARPA